MKKLALRPLSPILPAALLMLWVPPAAALINPRFTPIHLLNQSDLILVLKLGPGGPGGGIGVQLAECLKGKAPSRPLVLDLSKADKPQADALRGIVGSARDELALLFQGKHEEELGDPAAAPEPAPKEPVGLLHIQGQWFRLISKAPGEWLLDAMDERMQSCWAGGTDMLLRAARYLVEDPAAAVPVRAGAKWGERKSIAKLDSRVHGTLAPDLAGDGKLCLHVLCEAGDRVFRWSDEAKGFQDITARLKLGAKSRAAAWGDFDGDGRLDLASWDGESLTLWLQSHPGAFQSKALKAEMPKTCLGLSACDMGAGGKTALLLSTPEGPLLLQTSEVSKTSEVPLQPKRVVALTGGGSSLGDLGRSLPCFVADFDGDAIADILLPCAKGAVFYQGPKGGLFGKGGMSVRQVCRDVGTGAGDAGAFLGDFDADGLLDVFVAGEEGCSLWHNRGGGRFEETLRLAGEAAYISKPNAIGGATGDVNNDGRQDVLILYSNRAPHLFFNRGFRSFGHAHELDLEENQLLPAASDGQQAGLLADLNGDGAQDMALVLRNGEVWIVLRDADDPPATCLRAALPVSGPYAGPLSVTGWAEKRGLGAWNVVAGSSEAFFGLLTPGPCKVRWQFPGGEAQEKTISVGDEPMRALLKP